MSLLLSILIAPLLWTAPAAEHTPPPLRMSAACVPRAARRRVVRCLAADRPRLIGVELGSGRRGVVLAHGYHSSVCDWMRQARRLARGGYRVLVFDHRGHGSSAYTRARYWRMEQDVVGAVRTLRKRGARTVVLAGSSMGGTAVLAGAAALKLPVDGVVSLSGPTNLGSLAAGPAVSRLVVPMLFVAAEQDDPFDDDALTLFNASVARDKRLEVVPASDAHGTALLANASVRALFDDFLRTHSN